MKTALTRSLDLLAQENLDDGKLEKQVSSNLALIQNGADLPLYYDVMAVTASLCACLVKPARSERLESDVV